MTHTLPSLNYRYNSLEPYFDAQTMEIHHTRHHQTYVDKLNAALENHSQLRVYSIKELLQRVAQLPEEVQTAVRNNGGGHANHSFFWTLLNRDGPKVAIGKLAQAIDSTFGSFDYFKSEFANAALNRFGSGWAWLIYDTKRNRLAITSTPNQDSPLMEGIVEKVGEPIVGLDVWEHAYYLNYQNRRPAYVDAFWNVLDWNKAEQYYKSCVLQ